jgi:hypothetical protein
MLCSILQDDHASAGPATTHPNLMVNLKPFDGADDFPDEGASAPGKTIANLKDQRRQIKREPPLA